MNLMKAGALAGTMVLGAATAQAGGYVAPIVETEPAAPVVAPVGDWQGAYAGVTLGYAFKGKDQVGVDTTEVNTLSKLELSGANAGIRLGYRWQKDRWVFGPELGYEGGDIKDSFSSGGYDAESKVKNVFALRLKTGYDLGNGTLVYGIAGVGRAKVDYSVIGTSTSSSIAVDDSFSRTGYILGLGVEKKLNDSLSLTGEYEYANFGKETLADADGVKTSATAQYNNIKLGLNFKF
ncbi:MAG: outer membrane beta-barrel protein [Paracoccus sp. (in: a-proteobacteria)]|uniref:outer membrane protein n=1 Tax=Paracoccus sp. TaxID=267 RepID=UPI0039E2F634